MTAPAATRPIRNGVDTETMFSTERAKARSAVFDMVTNGVPVDVDVATG